MGATQLITRYVARLTEQAIFAAREVIHVGSGAAVYKALSRMVKKGRIFRLASGLYMKCQGPPDVLPSPQEVARAKARAWGKRIAGTEQDAAAELKMTNDAPQHTYFLANGCSTSFKYMSTTIHFRKTCPKKVLLGDGKMATYVKSLWYMGKYYCQDKENVSKLLSDVWLNMFERENMISFASIVPHWLRDNIIKTRHFWPLRWEREKRTPIDRLILTSDFMPAQTPCV